VSYSVKLYVPSVCVFFWGGGCFQYLDHIVLNGRMIDEESV
jgi:hypothetical protein